MGHFSIDGFDFGIDPGRSSLAVEEAAINLRVVGNESVVQELGARADHPWHWLIQPPFLYVLGLPCRIGANGDFVREVSEQELDDHDIALYAMEHCDVFPCRISREGTTVRIAGKVHGIRDRPLDFDCEFKSS